MHVFILGVERECICGDSRSDSYTKGALLCWRGVLMCCCAVLVQSAGGVGVGAVVCYGVACCIAVLLSAVFAALRSSVLVLCCVQYGLVLCCAALLCFALLCASDRTAAVLCLPVLPVLAVVCAVLCCAGTGTGTYTWLKISG